MSTTTTVSTVVVKPQFYSFICSENALKKKTGTEVTVDLLPENSTYEIIPIGCDAACLPSQPLEISQQQDQTLVVSNPLKTVGAFCAEERTNFALECIKDLKKYTTHTKMMVISFENYLKPTIVILKNGTLKRIWMDYCTASITLLADGLFGDKNSACGESDPIYCPLESGKDLENFEAQLEKLIFFQKNPTIVGVAGTAGDKLSKTHNTSEFPVPGGNWMGTMKERYYDGVFFKQTDRGVQMKQAANRAIEKLHNSNNLVKFLKFTSETSHSDKLTC